MGHMGLLGLHDSIYGCALIHLLARPLRWLQRPVPGLQRWIDDLASISFI